MIFNVIIEVFYLTVWGVRKGGVGNRGVEKDSEKECFVKRAHFAKLGVLGIYGGGNLGEIGGGKCAFLFFRSTGPSNGYAKWDQFV